MLPNRSLVRCALLAACCVLLLVPAGCGDDDPAAPEWPPAKVLVLEDDGTEGEVLRILTDAGMDVTLGGPWWQLDGAAPLDGYDAVVLLACVEYYQQMSSAAQVALTNYVAGGGGLLSTEWLTYYASRNAVLTAILPAEADDYDYEPETYTRQGDHPLTRGLPTTFATGTDSTGTDWTWVTMIPDTAAAKQAQVVYTGSASGGALVAGRWYAGRTVSWGMAGAYDGDDVWVPATERLLVNVVNWLAGR